MKVSKQVVSSDSLFLNLSPSLSLFSLVRTLLLLRSEFPFRDERSQLLGDRIFRRRELLLPLPAPSSTDRNESPLARSAPRTAWRLPRLVITRRFTDQRSITLARFRKCNRTPSWSDSRFFFHSTSGSLALQVDKSARRIALHRFCPLLTEVAPFFAQVF